MWYLFAGTNPKKFSGEAIGHKRGSRHAAHAAKALRWRLD